MLGLGSKYLALVACVVTMFINFVACGSQMYKVSLANDTHMKTTTGNILEGSDDPKSPVYGLHSTGGWIELPIKFKASTELSASQRAGLFAAIRIWEAAVGRKLFEFQGDDQRKGDDFKDLYSSLDDNQNGFFIDDNWAKMLEPDGKGGWAPKKNEVLATTIWDNSSNDFSKISQADMRFNGQYYIMGDAITLNPVGAREVVDMETLALHELGHLLGLAHVDQEEVDSIMFPSVYIGTGLTNRQLSLGDIKRIQKIYGCTGDACDHDKVIAAIAKMGTDLAKNSRTKLAEQGTAH